MLQLLDLMPIDRPEGPNVPSEPNYLALFGCVIITLIIAVCLYKAFGIKRVKVTKKTTGNSKKTTSSKKKATKKK